MISFLLLNLTACRIQYNLSTEKKKYAQIMDDLTSKKVIFIGENHDDVYPILFLKNYIEDFYKAGVRYIFFETGDDGYISDTNIQKADFEIIPPWTCYAWKYEQHLLEEEIHNINKKNISSPIKVFWPEYGIKLPESKDYTEIMNFRDNKIQDFIINILADSEADEKAIILYGADHGSCITEKYYFNEEVKSEWKMTGVYLKDYFGDKYSSYRFFSFDSNQYEKVVYKNKFDCVILSGQNFDSFVPLEYRKMFDFIAVYKDPVYGVIYPYIQSKQIFSVLERKSQDYLLSAPLYNSTYENIEGLLSVYYCNYLSEIFKTPDYKNSFEINSKQRQEEIESLEEYMKYLYAENFIESYLYNPANDERINYILQNMFYAKRINTKDIWPQYWISYFNTEKAIYSDKKSDYKSALCEWKKLMQNDLLYTSPVLKLTYQKIALCEEKLGNDIDRQLYLKKADNVSRLFDFEYKDYVVFGY